MFAILLKSYGNHEIIKVGFEILQKQIGTEVVNLPHLGEVKDFVKGDDLIFTDGFTVESYNEKKAIMTADCLGDEK